ncbi:MAG: hypothetical protein M1823_004399 [Watsoniomyces obsoletus]|nr:MAG: hypothetical protein M1823_004399 [Watsoniomyces obsoletus]
MPADHSKFLYTILKQLDMKSIDWATVATQLGITNGHAARMRFSRFKQAMEGVVPAPRKRTTGGGSNTSNSHRSRRVKTEKAIKAEKADAMKAEADAEGEAAEGKTDPKVNNGIDVIKTEPQQQQQQQQDVPSPSSFSPRGITTPVEMTTSTTTIIKPEPVEVVEVDVQDTTMLETFPGHTNGLGLGQGMVMMNGGSGSKAVDCHLGGNSNMPTSHHPMLDPALAQMSINSPGSGRSTFHTPMSPLSATAPSGPSRLEFGPFAGTYPPPGVTLPMQQQQQQQYQQQREAIIIDAGIPSQTATGMIKTEPRWDI